VKINDKLLKPIIETKYLTVDNADRYRSILRFFYLQYEKLKYWMYQEEVYEELHRHDYFKDYTIEQCQQDLAALVDWKNLVTVQDTRKVATIEEFKNKKFRYQLSEYSVEIERMAIRLENLFIEGASLEPTLLERIRNKIIRIEEISGKGIDEVFSWWNDLSNDFIRLNQNYQDYMRDLNSVKAEELMRSKEFLVFKDKLIEYLRTFVKSLQMNVGIIEQFLRTLNQDVVDICMDKVLEYELSIPRLDTEMKKEQILDRLIGRWESIRDWFVDLNGKGTEAGKVFDITNEIIRKITRYATQISERNNSGANRKEEYYKVACLFSKCSNIMEAHKLSANVFGVEQPFHLKGDLARSTESINSGVYDERPHERIIKPRIRNYQEKSHRSAIIDRTKEKEERRAWELERIEKEHNLLQSYIKDNCIDFETLPVIEPEVRNTLLLWLSKALENKNWKSKTQDGRSYTVQKPSGDNRCILSCTDGDFHMPSYRIIFCD